MRKQRGGSGHGVISLCRWLTGREWACRVGGEVWGRLQWLAQGGRSYPRDFSISVLILLGSLKSL